MTNDFSKALSGLPAGRVNWRLEHMASVGSTNTVVRERAERGEAEGLIVLADEQTAGRGRMGRSWIAAPGQALMLSVLLRPTWAAYLVTVLAGVALCEAVEQVAGVQAALKWPNDLLLDAGGAPRKAAGILCESGAGGWVVAGIGLNVGAAPRGVVDGRDLARQATSVSAAAGRPVQREALLTALLEHFDARYQAMPAGRAALLAAWRARLYTLGRSVSIQLAGGMLSGVAEGVSDSGALLVRDAAGRLHTITAGDVSA
jgi:BirA family biotin operon repressor/biotin-[acetyl-CoA-carboxylase] ligase